MKSNKNLPSEIKNHINSLFMDLSKDIEKDLTKHCEVIIEKRVSDIKAELSKTILELSERSHKQVVNSALNDVLPSSFTNPTQFPMHFSNSNNQIMLLVANQIKKLILRDL